MATDFSPVLHLTVNPAERTVSLWDSEAQARQVTGEYYVPTRLTTEQRMALAYAMSERTWCVVFRTGGTDNFSWHRSARMTRVDAVEARTAVDRMGYRALIVDAAASEAIGLPSTYEYTTRSEVR